MKESAQTCFHTQFDWYVRPRDRYFLIQRHQITRTRFQNKRDSLWRRQSFYTEFQVAGKSETVSCCGSAALSHDPIDGFARLAVFDYAVVSALEFQSRLVCPSDRRRFLCKMNVLAKLLGKPEGIAFGIQD